MLMTLVLCALVSCEKSNNDDTGFEVDYLQGNTDINGKYHVTIDFHELEIFAVDANTGEALSDIDLEIVISDGYISVLGSDTNGEYLPTLSGTRMNETEKGVLGIIMRFIKCQQMYVQNVYSSITTNTPEGIALLLFGGTTVHEEETRLGIIGQSFAEWGLLWAADEIVTLALSVKTIGVVKVVSWVFTAAELAEASFIEALRGFYYMQGYRPDDLFIQSNRLYSGPMGMSCIHHFLNIEPVGPPSGTPLTNGNLSLTVKDAVNNEPIPNVSVTPIPGTGEQIAYESNSSGFVSMRNLLPGSHQLVVQHPDYQVRFVNNVEVSETGTNDLGNVFLNRLGTVGSDRIRFVLSWGAQPRDLDLHMWYRDPDNTSHIYFSRRGSEERFPYIQLDVDVTSGFGPETITVHQLIPEGTYTLAVHEYSNSSLLTSSGAVVDIFMDETGFAERVEVPTGSVGNRWYWEVLRMDGNGNYQIVNNLLPSPPGGKPVINETKK